MNDRIIMSKREASLYVDLPFHMINDGNFSLKLQNSNLASLYDCNNNSTTIVLWSDMICLYSRRKQSIKIPIIGLCGHSSQKLINDNTTYNYVKILIDHSGVVYLQMSSNDDYEVYENITTFNRMIGNWYSLDVLKYFNACVKFGNFNERT